MPILGKLSPPLRTGGACTEQLTALSPDGSFHPCLDPPSGDVLRLSSPLYRPSCGLTTSQGVGGYVVGAVCSFFGIEGHLALAVVFVHGEV